MQIARARLVKIDHTKADIKGPNIFVVVGCDHYSAQAKDNVKDIVGWGSARQTLVRRDEKPCDPGQDQQRGEDQKDVVIQVHTDALIVT